MRIFALLILVSYSVYGNVKEEAEEAIKKITKFNTIEFVKYELDQETKLWIEKESKQRFFGSFLYKWTVFDSDTIKSIVFLDNLIYVRITGGKLGLYHCIAGKLTDKL